MLIIEGGALRTGSTSGGCGFGAINDCTPAGAALMPILLRDAVRQVRAITGFDRVMIYRFHDDGVGEVVAEATRRSARQTAGLAIGLA
jgi:hypothetical protein